MHLLEGLLLHMFQQLKKRCKEQVDLVHAVYQSPEFLIPEPGKEVRLTFAEGQNSFVTKALRSFVMFVMMKI